MRRSGALAGAYLLSSGSTSSWRRKQSSSQRKLTVGIFHFLPYAHFRLSELHLRSGDERKAEETKTHLAAIRILVSALRSCG